MLEPDQDINLFYSTSPKINNDKSNKIREIIIEKLINNDYPIDKTSWIKLSIS